MGKTHIATALGIKACENKLSVMFTSVPNLLVQIKEARSAKTLGMLQARFEKYDLVICDEFGYVIVVLICIYLMINDVEHFFIYLLTICIFFEELSI